ADAVAFEEHVWMQAMGGGAGVEDKERQGGGAVRKSGPGGHPFQLARQTGHPYVAPNAGGRSGGSSIRRKGSDAYEPEVLESGDVEGDGDAADRDLATPTAAHEAPEAKVGGDESGGVSDRDSKLRAETGEEIVRRDFTAKETETAAITKHHDVATSHAKTDVEQLVDGLEVLTVSPTEKGDVDGAS
ncbi:hypothetical protein HDU93_007446, partial [Gonapodya sp. JEL0774]